MAAAALAAFSGSGGSRQGAAPTASFPALLLLLLAVLSPLLQVSAVEVYTPQDFLVENGTEAKLPCTFTSTEVISSFASVAWSYQGEGSSSLVSFFYYSNGKTYHGKSTQFGDRSSWAGDLNRKDASITIANMQFQDNGTYICDVKNPPDIVVTPGKIKVRVMEKAVEVYTPQDFLVENGTEAKLPCTFTSTEVISSFASVAWSYQGEGSSSLVSFFYYSNGKTYHGKSTQFGDRSSWAGDLNRKDASITIANMQFQDNGTYICDVKNPPDIVVTPGKIKVRVMEKVQVSAVEVYTPQDFLVENGTEAKLPCTFTSTEVISSLTSVLWSFQGEGSSSLVSFFYYSNGKAYPGKSTQFDDRSSWAGDFNRKDASITIANMQFQDNGTYICDVKNPPDIVIIPRKIKVRVMEKGIVISG